MTQISCNKQAGWYLLTTDGWQSFSSSEWVGFMALDWNDVDSAVEIEAEIDNQEQQCLEHNRHRLPQAWIDILQNKAKPTGVWADFNKQHRYIESLCRISHNGKGVICPTDVPQINNISDYPDLTSPSSF